MKAISKSVGILLLATLSVLGCTRNEQMTPTAIESTKANALFERAFQDRLDRSPEFQSRLGIKKDADKWNDLSDEANKRELKIAKQTLKTLHDTIDASLLDEATALSYQLFEKQLKAQIEDFQYRLHNYPVNQMFGVHSSVPSFLINIHQIGDLTDAENYISRLNGIKAMFDQLIVGLSMRQERGVLPPKFVFARVLDDSQNIITGKPFDRSSENSALYEDFISKINKLDISTKMKGDLTQQAEQALLESMLPAYTKLIRFLQGQQRVATTDAGAWKLPDGENYYIRRLQRITTTDLTAKQIHEIGLKEVQRIHGEMRALKKKVGFKGNLQQFFAFMRDDKRFYYDATDEGRAAYITKARALIDTMEQSLDQQFISKPKADIRVKAVEPFREKSAGKAFYEQPAIDGSRPGTYYANLYDMKDMPTYQMEALAYHEGIPGHHMQLSIAQELGEIPKFRKFGRYTAYIEGWGLYAEWLPKEMGFYSDPYSDLGRLSMELWRACRLVVDTGIHAMKWSRQQGIDYYNNNTPNSFQDGVKMVERHIVIPGQATAYKVGMLKFQELREMAKKQLGHRFDVREFHEQVLGKGALPLDVVEAQIKKWIQLKAYDNT